MDDATGRRELEGRTALVTGAARGIGRACCERLARSGARVAINYKSSEAEARQAARRIEAAGGVAQPFRADVSSSDEVRHLVDAVARTLGPIDLLVNNAGIFDHVSHEATTPELWRRTLDRNLTGAFLVTWAVKDGMIARGFGRIVNIASIAGLRARPMAIAYAVSKAGMIALTRSLSEAVAAHDVRVNAVAPGLIDTEIHDGTDPGVLERLVRATPMARMGRPAEIAEVVSFLLSERSSFMTGQTLVASGGRVHLP